MCNDVIVQAAKIAQVTMVRLSAGGSWNSIGLAIANELAIAGLLCFAPHEPTKENNGT